MKNVIIALTLTVASLSCGATLIANPENNNQIIYTISIDSSAIRVVDVTVSFFPKDSMLYMTNGANQLPKRWATFVEDIRTLDALGNEVEINELPDARWELAASSQERITLTYRVKLDHDQYTWGGGLDGVAYVTEWGVFCSGRALLILNGTEWEDIQVRFDVPAQWTVTTPWEATDKKKNDFRPQNQRDLIESLMFMGTHEELTFKRGSFELTFALGGTGVIAEKEEYRNLAAGVMDYYIRLMGAPPAPGPENNFRRSLVIINESSVTDGEVIGNNISILVEADGDGMSKVLSKFIFAHEFFHLWNGKSFVPEDDQTEWFKEGFTNYYTLKALYQLGFLKEESYFQALNNIMFKRYDTDNGLGRISMIQGSEKHDHWGLIYAGGLFVAIAQDMIIRQETNNAKSIDDGMRHLFKKYGGTNESYGLDELQEIFSNLAGKSQDKFFSEHILGTMRIPIEQYLSMTSFNAVVKDGNLTVDRKTNTNQLELNMAQGLFGAIKD